MKSPSTISTTTVVRGNVSGDGSLEILGRVEGSVSMTGQVIVAANAVVKGNVSATEIQVAGNILGNLTASDLVMLNTGARVVGDLAAVRIGVAEGALVRGLVRTEGEPPLAQPAPTAATARGASLGTKLAAPGKSSFAVSSSVARPALAGMLPRPQAGQPPKPAPVAAPAHEKPPVYEPAPAVQENFEVDDSTNPPQAHHDNKPERQVHGAPPMVVPSIKGQIKAKKKLRGR